jgi:hypothetical protein
MDKRTQLYLELQEASKAANEANIQAHKVKTARIRNAHSLRTTLQVARPDTPVPKVPLDFLAIGDSWFEYPLVGNGPVPAENQAIVAPSQLQSMGDPPPQILSQALHGQATTAMLSYGNQEKMIAVLQDRDQWLNQQTGLPDGILVSAGGDDIVGDQLAIYLDYGGGGLNVQRFQAVLASVQASYMDLFAVRDRFAKGVPIIAHCYDYAIPNNVHPLCVTEGWLNPSLTFAGYDYSGGLNIVTQMIDAFHGMLSNLAANPAYNFTLIDTRNTLTRDASQPNGWCNEIHPYFTGFTALANKFLLGLRAMQPFSGRI